MRKLFSIFISLVLLLGIIPFNASFPTVVFGDQSHKNDFHTFIAKTLHPVGYEADGEPIDPDPAQPGIAIPNGRFFPWEYERGSSWGRREVSMPGSPVYWFEIYLQIQADGGESQAKHKWYGVIDSAGRMWLDPDGNFHDCNYDIYSDPYHPAYIAGRCENNPKAQIDPVSNTQGPYILNPKDPEYRTEIYFYDRLVTEKGWRIGWVDMVDYPAYRAQLPDGSISSGIVEPYDWDLDLPLERFNTNGDDIADEDEEWHTDQIVSDEYYTLGETIYRLTARTEDPLTELELRNTVHAGDTRLNAISVYVNGESFTYHPNTIVADGDKDIGMTLVPFRDNGNPVIENGEEWHTFGKPGQGYNNSQFIYLKINGNPLAQVQDEDWRMTNVNGNRDDKGLLNGGLFAGDLIVFAPVLEANCNGQNRYDISVETDAWLGVNPSITAARLFSPTGDTKPQSQRIQKSTVLDPDGRSCLVPATTFNNISFKHRQYAGIEIFADNGFDNNIGADYPRDACVPQNLSDDYVQGRIGEMFLGSVDGNYAFDFGRGLANFGYDVYFYNVGPREGTPPDDAGIFGCGEAIYRKGYFDDPENPPLTAEITEGDMRLTPVTISSDDGQIVTYEARTHVTEGDLDVGLMIDQMPDTIKYFNDGVSEHTEDYDYGEPIYFSDNAVVDAGDVRLSEQEFGGEIYNCNSTVSDADYWLFNQPVKMIGMGQSGDAKCIDIIVMPGTLDLEIEIDKDFKVEQTTTIRAKLNSDLEDGEKVYLSIKEPDVDGFGGVPAPPASYVETVESHQWLPIWPGLEEESEEEYLRHYIEKQYPTIQQELGEDFTPVFLETHDIELPQADPMQDYRLGEGYNINRSPYYTSYGDWLGPNNGTKWSDPAVYLRYRLDANHRTPLSGYKRGPYSWDIPSDAGGPFEFPFNNGSTTDMFKRLWVYVNPAVGLNNFGYGNTNTAWWQADIYMSPYYSKYYFQYPQYSNMTTPVLHAYSEHYYYQTICPPRFRTDNWSYIPSRGEYNSYYSYNYYPSMYYDYRGRYEISEQPLTNGIWGYVDDSVTPRRIVLTWIVNHSYDYCYTGYYGNTQIPYAPYRVQMVLYENGTIQYNYGAGNVVWSNQYSYHWNYTPQIGIYFRRGYATYATRYPHHLNKNLDNAPSVRWTYYQPTGEIKPHDPWDFYVDYRELDNDNKEVSFEYTPYRGTCKEDGTRDHLRITAFLDKNDGPINPVPMTPRTNVYYDLYDMPVGIARSEDAYVDMDMSLGTTAGDIRLTEVQYGGETYGQGTIVKDSDEDCIHETDSEAQIEQKMFDPADCPIGGALYTPYKQIVYADVNENGIADVGDIRLVGFGGYGQGTIVGDQDWEVYQNYRMVETPLFPPDAPVCVNDKKYVYWDRDFSQTMTRFDVRLTAIDSYLAGSIVREGDMDVGDEYMRQNVPLGIHDPLPLEPYNDSIEFCTNVYAHLGNPNNSLVEVGDIRIADVYIMTGTTVDQVLKGGTVVQDGDPDVGDPFDEYQFDILYWDNAYGTGIYANLNENPIQNGSTQCPNTGDVRLIPNKYKQNPYPYGTWYYLSDGGSWNWNAGTIVIPFYYYPSGGITYPYPWWYGNSFDNADGNYYAYQYPGFLRTGCRIVNNVSVTFENRIYLVPNIPAENYVAPGHIRMTEIGVLQQGTEVDIDSLDRASNFMYDPYWSKHPWTKIDLDENPEKSVVPIPQVDPKPTMPSKLNQTYDCFSLFKYDIAPEELILEAASDCIDLYEQRFPNVDIRVLDADNPNDVNDPANIVVSGHEDEPMVMNFNAHGGGIKFLFTAVAQPPSYQKYIGQYNEDGTVVFWYWYDNAPWGVFDPGDFLKATYDCNKSGPFKPVGSNPTPSPYPYSVTYSQNNPPFKARIWDIDCSFGQSVCTIPGDVPGFPKLGEVNNRMYYFAFNTGDINGRSIWNMGDHIINENGSAPSFDGNTVDPQIVFCSSCGDGCCTIPCSPRNYGTVWTYGVPVQVSNWTGDDEGGRIQVPVKPFETDTPVTIRLYSSRILYDYNSRYPHGPAFIHDTGSGIDYVGTLDLKVLEPDPKLNFGEVTWIDHGLQNSKVNYTSGNEAVSPKVYPTPQIHADYDPALKDLRKDFRAYPGGQTHTGRVPDDQHYAGFNSYPALWPKMFNKLGTEMTPFTDYGLYFIMYDGFDDSIYWDANVNNPNRNIKKITLEGPFMRPKNYEGLGSSGTITQALTSDYPDNLPVQYDFSGKVEIDIANQNLYSTFYLPDVTSIASPFSSDAFVYEEPNERLIENNDLWYYGRKQGAMVSSQMYDNVQQTTETNLHQIHVIDEIIPIQHGKLSLTVELYDGTIKRYQECCEEIYDDIPVNALAVEPNITSLEVDTDTKVSVSLKEYDTKSMKPEDHIIPCNDALVLIWQDRGIRDERDKITGAGDGWITSPPRSSILTSSGSQYNEWFDVNDDGKISYSDWETEIVGTYDMATNTWKAGVIDARTFHRNEGTYIFDLSQDNGAQVDTVGVDFGGPVSQNHEKDHVIDDYELLPLYVTAYKYGDDDNDRSFAPYWSLNKPYEFSHEVYISGLEKVDVVPKNDWVVSYGPSPLTAGCVPELLSGEQPLTFSILDAQGNPVDLSKGIPDPSGNDLVEDDVIWNVLIKDPHPDNKDYFGRDAVLPRYYWVRTDLHNNDGSMVNNYRMYSFSRNPFLPIVTNFDDKENGNYIFEGFCANDQGNMKVFVDSPDRKHRGIVDVKVELPNVTYGVINYELLRQGLYNQLSKSDGGGSPDYIMTAANRQIYYIYPFIFDASGNPIVGEKTSECGSSTGAESRLTRFTPYNTNMWYFDETDLNYELYYMYELRKYVLIPVSTRSANYAWSLWDKNPDFLQGNRIAGFPVWTRTNWQNPLQRVGGYTYYNTTNWQYEDQTFELQPVFDVPPARNIRGWGRGCAYNHPYEGGYLFPDWNGADGYLGAKDSTEVTQPGETFFLFNPDYACDYGILVGKNPYSNSVFGDVAGGMGNFRGIETYPLDIKYRFNTYISDTTGFSNEDGTFRMDWDAFVNHDGAVRNPKVSLYDETTGKEMGKNLLNPNNYDLIYGQDNFIKVKLAPNSSPDFPMIPDTLVRIGEAFPDSRSENFVEAKTWIEDHEENLRVDGKVETVLKITPTGSWKDLAEMIFFGIDLNNNYIGIRDLAKFDVVKSIDIQIKTSRQLRVNQTDTITIYVREIGTEKPLPDADVRLQGPGINEKGKTDDDGKVSFSVTPNDAGVITVTAKHDLGEDTDVIVILSEEKNNSVTLNISPIESETRLTEIEIIGQTDSSNQVTINNESTSVKNDGFFTKLVSLEEGMNTIHVIASSSQGNETKRIVRVLCDTKVDYTIDPIPEIVEDRDYALSGTIEDGGSISVQGKDIEVLDGRWKTTLSLDFGKNNVTIESNDELGNKAKKDVEVIVYRKMEVKLTIGSTKMTINGTPADKPLSAPPYIRNERTFVPIRVISEAFGADVTWYPQTKGIVIEFMERKIEMQVGSKEAFINGKKVILTNAPEIKNGSTFVPLRFVTESLDAVIGWNPDAREITITLYAY